MTISKDYAYCSGVTCKLRKQCKRYLPNPPDEDVRWMSEEFIEDSYDCVNMDFIN